MPEIKNIKDVHHTIKKLQESLISSTEILTMFDELIVFIQEIVPLMLEVNSSIIESSNVIPGASETLTNVSKTTEMATSQVLDKLDTVIEYLELLTKQIYDDSSKEIKIETLDKIKDETSEIFFSFQYQDITTQKLDHVNRIITEINNKFSFLFNSFNKIRESSEIASAIINVIENDMNINSKLAIKAENFRNKTEDIIHESKISQEDIDQYFN